MNVVFLDIDGVVNIPIWDNYNKKYTFCYPTDGTVNGYQNLALISDFCRKFHYSIVISSTWRSEKNCEACLRNGGLHESVKIVGNTPDIFNGTRKDEIQDFLFAHPEVEQYLVFDDNKTICSFKKHYVKCNPKKGFLMKQYRKAEKLHTTQQKHQKQNRI